MTSFSVQEVVEVTGGRVVNSAILGDQLDQIRVERPSTLTGSQPNHIGFFFSRAFEQELPTANPGILLVGEPFVKPLESSGLPIWKKAAIISCTDPYFAMALISQKFAASLSTVTHLPRFGAPGVLDLKTEVHPSAVVSPTAELGEGVRVDAHCVIEDHVKIGAGSILYPGCFVGPGCVIGENTILFPRVTLYEWTQLGNRVRIHSGAVLGADGFGYAPKRVEQRVQGHQKIYHLGRVVVGNDVEIGANACIDRGTFGETRIENNSKIDNMVQVGHNAHLAEGAIVCGCTALAGNSSVGKYAYVAGVCGIANHVHVGDGAIVAAQTLVSKDVPSGGCVAGNPQRDSKEHFRAHAALNKMISKGRSK